MGPSSKDLQRYELLNGLPPAFLNAIADIAKQEQHREGDVLFMEGEDANSLYLIESGKISLETNVQLGRTGTPRRASLGVIGITQVAGWSCLVPPHIYTSSGVCLQDTHVLVLPGEELREIIHSHPAAGCQLMERVASITRDRLISATSSLTYFLSIISHELKRPIAAVENYLQILMDGFAGEINDKQRHLLERSTLRLIDLRALISDVLDFARMQPEQIRADFEIVDPAAIGAEALEEVRLAASQKNIRLRAVGKSSYRPIIASRRRLRQVISNLLANAIKFSPEGTTVTLSAHEEDEFLVVEVMDEGIGIPAEDQEHIFDDFYRGSNANEISGSGLGLSITKKIVDAHEGYLEIESPYEPDHSGTKFTIRLPNVLPQHAVQSAPSAGSVDRSISSNPGKPWQREDEDQ